MKKILIFISFLYISVTLSILSAEIKLSISKPTVGLDDTFFLDFITQGNPQGRPDFTSLQPDFKIISQSQNHSTSIINGNFSVETRWHLVLRPKHEGQLTIPSISFGNEFSPSKTIEVTSANTAHNDDSIFLESEITPPGNIYEQSQFVYIVRLYRSVNLAQASLSEPKSNDPDTLIERLGPDHEYEHTHPNGVRYLILERRYAISPQHAGELTFSPVIFEGEVIKSRNMFFNVETDFKRVFSKEVVVYVNPIPAAFTKNNWLAANDVKLTEEWTADPTQMTVGEPITWTLTLTAERCLGDQVPEIALDLPSSLKFYRDKTEINNLVTPQGFTGVKKLKVALIPTKSEEIKLPEINIPWWDMKGNKIKLTTLPSRILHIKEGLIAMNAQPPVQATSAADVTPSLEPVEILTEIPNWAWALVAVNAILVLSYIGNKFRSVIKTILVKILAPSARTSRKQIKKLLKHACYANDAKHAELHLLALFNALYPEEKSLNLMSIKSHLSPKLQEAIRELNAALYGSDHSWEGRALWKEVKGFRPKR